MRIKNVVLDFGHGGINECGEYTTAPYKMFTFRDGEKAYEGFLNRQIGGLVYTMLRNHLDLNVVCTVKEDDPRDISLRYRVRLANSYEPKETIFVSIHCNAGGGTGFELFTSRGYTESDELAETIAEEVEELYEEVGLRLRYDFRDGDRDKEIDFYVLRRTLSPAVLLECGFFDNREDFELLKSAEFQSKLALKIYKGILKFIENKDD